jgi:hypothetical protein
MMNHGAFRALVGEMLEAQRRHHCHLDSDEQALALERKVRFELADAPAADTQE